MINLTTLSTLHPVQISEDDYDLLVQKKDKGWTYCETSLEWLAKLHYIRKGFKEKKMAREKFTELEKDLVLRWWKRWC